jgi:hypothetical protein
MDHTGGRGRRGNWPRRPGPARRETPGPASPYEPVTPLEIVRAVDVLPVPARRARGQREWMHALARDAELAELRADRQRNIRKVAQVLARHASWADRTTRPTRALICALAGISLSTWKACRRWLERHGWLGTVRQGRTQLAVRITTAILNAVLGEDDKPNEAAIYVLCVPAPAGQDPRRPSAATHQHETRPLTPARSAGVKAPARQQTAPGENPGTDQGQSPLSVIRYLREQLAELGRGPGRRLSDRRLYALARPMLAAGWSPADLAFALNHHPAEGRYGYVQDIREPAHWIAARLSAWMRDPEGARAGNTRHGRWDWSGDPNTWPLAALSPSARRAAAHSADVRAGQQLPDYRAGASAPSAEYRNARARLSRPRKGDR